MKLIFSLALAFALTAMPAMAQSIGGTYAINGTNLDGSKYGGKAEIKLLSKTTCAITWYTGGGSTSKGICMRYANAFSASYVMGGAMGLVIYQVLDDGRLQGIWTVTGQNGVGKEILTPVN